MGVRCIPLVQCMTNNTVDICLQVHQMPLAMNPEVTMPYPSLAYLAEMIVEKTCAQNISIIFPIVNRRKCK